MGTQERSALTAAFTESLDIRVGFNSSASVEELESLYCETYGQKYAVAFNGANTAMDLTLKTLSLTSDDEVISAAANFHGQHLAILGTSARLVFADISPDDHCLSYLSLRAKLSASTKAIIVTDIHGACADYNNIFCEVSDSSHRRPYIIADAARSIGCGDGKAAASQVDAMIFSMQSKKLISTLGEGGMVVTNDEALASELRRMRAFGLGAAWGSNYKLSKLQAAVGVVQFKRLPELVEQRGELAFRRVDRLRDLDQIIAPVIPKGRSHTFQFFPLMLKTQSRTLRDALIEELALKYSVGTVVANPPTYQYNKWISEKLSQRLPKSERITENLICLSFHHSYTRNDEQYICDSLNKAIEECMKHEPSKNQQ
jgi:dTDP-4-amino-4,6-dideoxygalactose transaminase